MKTVEVKAKQIDTKKKWQKPSIVSELAIAKTLKGGATNDTMGFS
jgi:hypothetical protein